MTKEGAGAGPISGAQRFVDGNASSHSVRDGNGACGARRRQNPSAPEGPTDEAGKGRDRDGTMRRRRRGKDVGVLNTQSVTRAKKLLKRRHRTWGCRWRKTPDDDRRPHVSLTIRFTKPRREKTDLIRRNVHEGGVATQRRQLRWAPRRRHGKKEGATAL